MKPTPPTTIDTSPGARRRRARRRVQYALVLIGGVILLDSLVGEDGLIARIQARRQYQVLERSVEVLRIENAQLREDARRLREDPAAIEEEARQELGLIKPGERLFILRDVEPPDAEPDAAAPPDPR